MDTSFCVEALDEALGKNGSPEIFNSDQGSQFTSQEFIDCLTDRHISISMDGKGRYIDNIFIERLWRSVKYEDVYIKGYGTMLEAYRGLKEYFEHYNGGRLHKSLGRRRPSVVYEESLMRQAA